MLSQFGYIPLMKLLLNHKYKTTPHKKRKKKKKKKQKNQNSTSTQSKPLSADCIIKLNNNNNNNNKNNNNNIQILAAKFCDKENILIVFGSLVKPYFKKVNYLKELDPKHQKEIFVSVDYGAVVPRLNPSPLNEEDKESEKGKEKEKEKEEEQTNTQINKETETENELEVLGPESIPLVKSDKNEDNKTFAEKLMSLKNPTPTNTDPDTDTTNNTTTTTNTNTTIPSIGSLSAVLIQALQTDDKYLFERIIDQASGASDKRIVSTVQRLPPHCVIALLKRLVERFVDNPNRMKILPWLKALFVWHSAVLMTNPAAIGLLGTAYRAMEEKVANFNSVLRLNGRLELMMNQIELANKRKEEEEEEERKKLKEKEEEEEREREEAEDDDDEHDDEEEEEEEMEGAEDNERDEKDDDDDEDDSDSVEMEVSTLEQKEEISESENDDQELDSPLVS